jgi:hypothetical protein
MTAPIRSAVFKLSPTPVERRERRPVSLSGFASLEDGTTAEILVVDLSYEGCGIEIPIELEAGQPITLSVLRRGAINADVRWYAKGKAGLVFRSEAEPDEPQRPRVEDRITLTAEVRTKRLGKFHYRVALFDLSSHGCKVELIERPQVGEHLIVKFDGLEPIQAEVCWVEGASAGLRFHKPIHSAVFELLIERLRVE